MLCHPNNAMQVFFAKKLYNTQQMLQSRKFKTRRRRKRSCLEHRCFYYVLNTMTPCHFNFRNSVQADIIDKDLRAQQVSALTKAFDTYKVRCFNETLFKTFDYCFISIGHFRFSFPSQYAEKLAIDSNIWIFWQSTINNTFIFNKYCI